MSRFLKLVALLMVTPWLPWLWLVEHNGDWLFALLPLGLLTCGAIGIYFGLAENDEHADQLANVVDLIRGYPDDWKLDHPTGARLIRSDRWTLHDNTRILDETYRYRGNDGWHEATRLLVRVYDPTDESVYTDYEPNAGYRRLIRKAIADMVKYREMKRFVNVAIEAEEKKSPPDKAREALANFKKKKGMEQDVPSA